MIGALTGTGLAISAGLNAFIPLLTVGLLARYTEVLTLPVGWEWLTNGWVLGLFAALLLIDVVADKVPVVDHLQDVLQTLVRPASGGIVFSAGIGSKTVTVTDPAEFVGSEAFGMFVIGLLVALAMHVAKAVARAGVNVSTAGIGAPLASTAEDGFALAMSISAVLVPVLVLALLAAVIFLLARLWRRRTRRRLGEQLG